MDAELIIKSIMGLVVILAILMFLLFLEPKEEKVKKQSSKKKTTVQKNKKGSKAESPNQEIQEIQKDSDSPINTDLNYLAEVIKNKRSDASKLSEALELIIEYHGRVHKKLGVRAHPDFDIYMDILFTICRHPNANKDMIIKFDRDLERLNPEYRQEINDSITKGLNSRGI